MVRNTEQLDQPIVAEITESAGSFQEFMGQQRPVSIEAAKSRPPSGSLPLEKSFIAAIAIDEIRAGARVQAEVLAADPKASTEQRKDEVVEILVERAKEDKR